MINQLKEDVANRMAKSVESLHQELTKLRTGRANPSLLEHIVVPYYGHDTPLNQLATLSTLDARTLQIAPWEKSIIPAIEKAIRQSDLGLNPVTASDVVRIPLPALTQQRRKELLKMVKSAAEKAKIAIRNIRRDANDKLGQQLKAKQLSEDEERHIQGDIQTITDQYIDKVDSVIVNKEKDLMAI